MILLGESWLLVKISKEFILSFLTTGKSPSIKSGYSLIHFSVVEIRNEIEHVMLTDIALSDDDFMTVP